MSLSARSSEILSLTNALKPFTLYKSSFFFSSSADRITAAPCSPGPTTHTQDHCSTLLTRTYHTHIGSLQHPAHQDLPHTHSPHTEHSHRAHTHSAHQDLPHTHSPHTEHSHNTHTHTQMDITHTYCWQADADVKHSRQSLLVPPFRLTTVGQRTFPVAASLLCNSLSSDIQSSPSLPVFRQRLQAFLSRQPFCNIVLWLRNSSAILAMLKIFDWHWHWHPVSKHIQQGWVQPVHTATTTAAQFTK